MFEFPEVRPFVRSLEARVAPHPDDDLHAAIRSMIAGRLQRRAADAPLPGKRPAGALDFSGGTLVPTGARTGKRTSVRVVRGDEALRRSNPGSACLRYDTPIQRIVFAERALCRLLRRGLPRALEELRTPGRTARTLGGGVPGCC